MDQVRNFAQTNRSSIVNIIYIVAAIVLVYYLVMYYFNSGDLKDIQVVTNKLKTNTQAADGGAQQKVVEVVAADSTTARAGAEYTISAWIYVNSYNTSGDKFQSVLAFFDDAASASTTLESALFMGLHPTQPKMVIRPGKIIRQSGGDMVTYDISGSGDGRTFTHKGSALTVSSTADTHEVCDVMDIDLQRWMNVTVSMNGRIMDVYLDGKLARSCILPNVQDLSTKGAQAIVLCPTNTTFTGYISGVMYSNYAVTPDVIYARYQAGPYFSSSFLDYLVDKLGIRISYTGTGASTTGSTSILSALGIKTA